MLYVVATPIGNLRDLSPHARDVLATADLIAAEDTRVTGQMLATLGIQTKLMSCREHNERAAAEKILAALRAGQAVALVSDAGTPGISDPGARVIAAARAAGLPVAPVAGPSAVAAALSVAGLADGPWLFYGFLPARTAARKTVLEGLKAQPCALVFYEAPHRILETLDDLAAVFGETREVFMAREITKRFEQFHRAAPAAMAAWTRADADRQRGEFVLVLDAPPPAGGGDALAEAERVLDILLAECPVSQAARLTARITGQKKSALYDLALAKGNPDA